MLFQILGMIHPMLRTVKLPSELLNKKNRVIKLRVGNPISVETQNSFADLIQYGKFLRAKTYLLGSSLEVKKIFPEIPEGGKTGRTGSKGDSRGNFTKRKLKISWKTICCFP